MPKSTTCKTGYQRWRMCKPRDNKWLHTHSHTNMCFCTALLIAESPQKMNSSHENAYGVCLLGRQEQDWIPLAWRSKPNGTISPVGLWQSTIACQEYRWRAWAVFWGRFDGICLFNIKFHVKFAEQIRLSMFCVTGYWIKEFMVCHYCSEYLGIEHALQFRIDNNRFHPLCKFAFF